MVDAQTAPVQVWKGPLKPALKLWVSISSLCWEVIIISSLVAVTMSAMRMEHVCEDHLIVQIVKSDYSE